MDKEFVTAVINNEYNKFVELNMSGYIPPIQMLTMLEPMYSEESKVTIKKIFKIDFKENLDLKEDQVADSTREFSKSQDIKRTDISL
jgi:hypothetical protein